MRNFEDKEIEEINKIVRLYERREKILKHNNSCIIEVVTFYENFILDYIIEPFFFNENYKEYSKLKKYVRNRMSFMDKFEIIVEIARKKNIKPFKKFDDFIRLRNEIAHNLCKFEIINKRNKEQKIFFGGKIITWNKYLNEIENWTKISLDMAKFIKDIYFSINENNQIKNIHFDYCNFECGLILLKYNLSSSSNIFDKNYINFSEYAIDFDIIDYIKEENDCKFKGDKK